MLPGAQGAVESPQWWLRRLHRELENRRPQVEMYNDYYVGNHPLPWLPSQARAEFRRGFKMSRANVCGLIIDATAERISAEGFRLPKQEEADEKLWRIWQQNRMDGDSDLAILEALICGQSYTLVEPSDTDTPNIYVEHACQAILAFRPGTNRRAKAAGLKVWVDEWNGNLAATVYLPEWIFKFEAEYPKDQAIDPDRTGGRRRPGRGVGAGGGGVGGGGGGGAGWGVGGGGGGGWGRPRPRPRPGGWGAGWGA